MKINYIFLGLSYFTLCGNYSVMASEASLKSAKEAADYVRRFAEQSKNIKRDPNAPILNLKKMAEDKAKWNALVAKSQEKEALKEKNKYKDYNERLKYLAEFSNKHGLLGPYSPTEIKTTLDQLYGPDASPYRPLLKEKPKPSIFVTPPY